MKFLLALAIIAIPVATFAQEEGSLQGLIAGVLGFINEVIIPVTLGIAFLIFLINAVRFFIVGGNNTEGQEKARSLALYGIGAFVLILSLWGLVNILTDGIGLGGGPCINGDTVQSDYIDSNPPCSSPRPQPRPTGPYMPTGGPGTFPVAPNGTPSQPQFGPQ